MAVSEKKSGKKYPTEKLLKSSQLKGYQPDFARVVLTEPMYGIEEAKALLDQTLKKQTFSGDAAAPIKKSN